jgi:hypothetical protein
MSEVEDRLGERREGESVDDYVRRGFAESSGGRRYVAELESGDRRYGADKSYKGTKYASDNSLKGTKYSSDRGLEGTKYSSDRSLEGTRYSSDRSLEGTKYRADVDERGNRMSAGNTFLKTYADLSSQPSNYFAAQNFLHNGVGAGYAAFVDEATGTAMPGRRFHPYVGAFPGNAAQAMFAQGGDDARNDLNPEEARPAAGVRYLPMPGRTYDPAPRNDLNPEEAVFVEPTTGTYWRDVFEPTTGRTYRVQVERPETSYGFDQGGDEDRRARRRLYVSGLDHRFGSAYGRNDVASGALADWRRESGRRGPDLDDPTDRANFERYVEDWRGVHVPAAPVADRRPSFTDRRTGRFGIPGSFLDGPYEQGGGAMPYHQAGADWQADDTWATPEDRQRLEQMDKQFRPGVHRWKAGYWAGLDDTDKDLWRSYFSYRGLSPKSVEADIESAQPYNATYFGQGRIA